MIQPPRHLDPSMLKQQTSPQPPSLHQPGLKSYLDSLISQNAVDMQKEQAMNQFTNFPLSGCPPHPHSRPTLSQAELMHQQAAKPNMMPNMYASEMAGCAPTGNSHAHNLLSPAMSNGHVGPGSPLPSRSARSFACPENNRGE